MKESTDKNIPAVQLINVSKTYDGTPPVNALANISMSVSKGEFVAVSYTHLTLPTSELV